MDDQTLVRDIPQDFGRFAADPPQRLFAVLDDRGAGEEAVRRLRAAGLAGEDDIWVFLGEEGQHRLELSGPRYRRGGGVVPFVQRLMSADVVYLHRLDVALRDGRMVVAVSVGPDDLDRCAAVVRAQGGHSMARVARWDYVPAVPVA